MAKQGTIFFDNCIVERCVLVRRGTLNMATGEQIIAGEGYEVRPCNAPLFGDDHKSGVCESCASGWSHPDNAPTPDGIAIIAAMRKSA